MQRGWGQGNNKRRASKRKRGIRQNRAEGLEEKVRHESGQHVLGLDSSSDCEDDARATRTAGLYGNRSVVSNTKQRRRIFRPKMVNDSMKGGAGSPTTKTPAPSQDSHAHSAVARGSFSLSSRSKNPYQKRSTHTNGKANQPRHRPKHNTSAHIVCAVSENLAKETCVASIDAGAPIALQVTKQGNGQTYAETLSYLSVLQPHEVLLNEGRRNSQLAKKVLELYEPTNVNPPESERSRRRPVHANRVFTSQGGPNQGMRTNDDLAGPPETSTVVKFVPRSYFDQTKGAEMLRRVSKKDTYDSNVVEEYILLSASHALLHYTSLCLGAFFSRSCLELSVNTGGSNRMAIDRASLLHLELLANAKTGKIANSLIGTVDNTKTTVGSRLLRTNLMAPPTRTDTIEARLDLVDTFLEDEDFFYTVMENLESLPDSDKMLSNVLLVPRKTLSKDAIHDPEYASKIASKGISALVCIKSLLSFIPTIASAIEDKLNALERQILMEHRTSRRAVENIDSPTQSKSADEVGSFTDAGVANVALSPFTDKSRLLIGLGGGIVPANSAQTTCRHQLLRAIMATMKQPALAEILNAVTDIFTESTTFSRNAHAMRHQECFALKPGSNGMMDVLRKAYLANVDDIYRLADQYAESYEMSVTVKESSSRGYFFAVPGEMASDLPQVFIQPCKSGRSIHCTTEQVLSLNARAQDNVLDLQIMTHEKIHEVLAVARLHYDALASLSDAIALLDMCHCFADNVASSRLQWCRPIVTDGPAIQKDENGACHVRTTLGRADLAIKNGRYGIDTKGFGIAADDSISEFIPNDTFVSEFQNFTVVTGINGSGKSLYLKQIAIIVALAQCGSYVPAEEAFIPVRDRICTRIGTSDDQEHNISTFTLEMKETAFICNKASKKSLILVDELGRATSNEDGVAIAWAVSEFLLKTGAVTFFVTHYPQLSKLATVYQNVQNQHMGATVSGNEVGDIFYSHKILPGPCQMGSNYGVEMSVTCGWPSEVVSQAQQIREFLEKKLPNDGLCRIEHDAAIAMSRTKRQAEEALHTMAEHLVALNVSDEGLTAEAEQCYLEDLRRQLIRFDDKPFVDCVKSILTASEMSTAAITFENSSSVTSNQQSAPQQDEEQTPHKVVANDAQSQAAADAEKLEGNNLGNRHCSSRDKQREGSSGKSTRLEIEVDDDASSLSSSESEDSSSSGSSSDCVLTEAGDRRASSSSSSGSSSNTDGSSTTDDSSSISSMGSSMDRQ